MRSRFGIRSALIVTGMTAVLIYFALVPTFRAVRFVALVREGHTDAAVSMISQEIKPDDPYRHVLQFVASIPNQMGVAEQTIAIRQIEIENLTFSQLLKGERSVIIGQGWGGGSAQFVVNRSTIEKGWNWFHLL